MDINLPKYSLTRSIELRANGLMGLKRKMKSNRCKISKKDDRNSVISKTLVDLSKLLCEASNDGNTKEVRKLLANGASVHSFGIIGMNPLHLAATNGHLEICKILKNLVLINSPNKVGKTALHLASVNGHAKVVSYLLRSGALVDTYDMLRMTALHWACDRGHLSVAHLLMRFGANPQCKNKFQKSPIDLAKEKKFTDIINVIESFHNKDGDLMSVCSETKDQVDDVVDTSSESFYSEDSEDGRLKSTTADNANECSSSNQQQTESTPAAAEERKDSGCNEPQDSDLEGAVGGGRDSDVSMDSSKEDEEEELQDALLSSLEELQEAAFRRKSYKFSNVCISEATEILRAQAALVSLQDPGSLLQRAMTFGYTIQLTEAGQKALAMIKPDPIIPTQYRREEYESGGNLVANTSSHSNTLEEEGELSTTNTCSALVLHQGHSDKECLPFDDFTSSVRMDKNSATQAVNAPGLFRRREEFNSPSSQVVESISSCALLQDTLSSEIQNDLRMLCMEDEEMQYQEGRSSK